eukprot:9804526-Lingulodinium_polyedra.AAC.1
MDEDLCDCAGAVAPNARHVRSGTGGVNGLRASGPAEPDPAAVVPHVPADAATRRSSTRGSVRN